MLKLAAFVVLSGPRSVDPTGGSKGRKPARQILVIQECFNRFGRFAANGTPKFGTCCSFHLFATRNLDGEDRAAARIKFSRHGFPHDFVCGAVRCKVKNNQKDPHVLRSVESDAIVAIPWNSSAN